MGAEQKKLDAISPASRIRSGTLGPTGPAPLVPSGVGSGLGTKTPHSVLVQWATGTAWVGGTGIATGGGYQLGPSGLLAVGNQEVRIRVTDLSKVWVHATQGVVRWIAD